jgi:uncharacterized protein with ParB-like and HNH nuclease domain
MADFKLTELVLRVDQDKLVIPDFQRGFKWQTPDVRKLLESLLLDFPIGAALFWRTQRGMLDFRRIGTSSSRMERLTVKATLNHTSTS